MNARWPYYLAAGLVLLGCALGAAALPSLAPPGGGPTTAAPATRNAATPATPSASSDGPVAVIPSALPASGSARPPTPTPRALYTVQGGDTLLAIAYRFDVAMARIQIENGFGDDTTVRVGQTLRIPSPVLADEQPTWRARVVRPGDTLLSIAAEAGVSLASVDRVNGLNGSRVIRLDDILILPTGGPAAPAPPSPPPATSSPTQPPFRVPAPTTTLVVASPTAAVVRSPIPPSPTVPLSPTPARSGGEAEDQLLALYNGARSAAGVVPLKLNAALSAAARAHAADCAARGFGSHVGSDGADTKTRILRAGYANPSAWGENWAWAGGAAQAWDMWFTQEYPSGPHRDNILSPRYTEVGFGVVAAVTGFYFIADFGNR